MCASRDRVRTVSLLAGGGGYPSGGVVVVRTVQVLPLCSHSPTSSQQGRLAINFFLCYGLMYGEANHDYLCMVSVLG
jgi:hypothetical protein